MKVDTLFIDAYNALHVITTGVSCIQDDFCEDISSSVTEEQRKQLLETCKTITASALRTAKDVDDLRNTVYSLKEIEAIPLPKSQSKGDVF